MIVDSLTVKVLYDFLVWFVLVISCSGICWDKPWITFVYISPISLTLGQWLAAVYSSISVQPRYQISLRLPLGLCRITSGAIHFILPLISSENMIELLNPGSQEAKQSPMDSPKSLTRSSSVDGLTQRLELAESITVSYSGRLKTLMREV